MIGRVRLGLVALSLLVIGIVAWRSVPAPVPPPLPKQQPYCAPVSGDSAAKGCRYDTGVTDQSPSIQISRNGTLFIGRNAAGVLRSADKGLTWQAITPPVHANGDSHAKDDERRDRLGPHDENRRDDAVGECHGGIQRQHEA